MTPSAKDAHWIKDKSVAFTGRLASMTRTEAAALIRSFGGVYVAAVNRQTAFLVVGQEGWPLRKDGGLALNLKEAQRLQQAGAPIVILLEEDLFDRLGLDTRSRGVHRLYTAAQIHRLLRVSRDRVRNWMRAGLVRPVETVHGVNYFDFQQVTGVRTLCDLAQAGVTPEQIRRSLEQLSHWMPGLDQPLTQLALIERDGHLLVRLEEGRLAEPTGQLRFDFADDSQPAVIEATAHGRPNAEECFAAGCDLEEAGHLHEAAASYRQALLLGGPDAATCFNLANVLYALGEKEQSAERFRQAVEIDHGLFEAWNNLGDVLSELDHHEDAVAAFQQALALQPCYADAHYNLADTLEQLGRTEEAHRHWLAYLRLEPSGVWADYARSRLQGLSAI